MGSSSTSPVGPAPSAFAASSAKPQPPCRHTIPSAPAATARPALARASSGGRSRSATSLASSRPRTVSTARAGACCWPCPGATSPQLRKAPPGRPRPGRRPPSSGPGPTPRPPVGRAPRSPPPPRHRLAPRPGRSSAPGYARSTTAGRSRRGRRGGNGPHNRRPGTPPAPSKAGCEHSCAPGRAQLEISYHSRPASPSTWSARTYLSAWSSSSGWRAGSAARGVPGSTVRAYALTWAGAGSRAEHALQRGTPVGQGLAGGPEDQVDAVGAGEARLTGRAGRRRRPTPGRAGGRARRERAGPWTGRRRTSLVTPPDRRAASLAAETVSGLHSTVTSAPAATPMPSPYGVQDGYEGVGRQQRRRPAPEEDRRRRPPSGTLEPAGIGDAGSDVRAATARTGRTRWQRRNSRTGGDRTVRGRRPRKSSHAGPAARGRCPVLEGPVLKGIAYVTRVGTDIPRPGLAAPRYGGTLAGTPLVGRRGPTERGHRPGHLRAALRGGRGRAAGHPQRATGDLRPQPGGPRRGPTGAAGGVAPEGLAATAGHSLGEYSALVAAGALEASEGARLVRARGEAMQAAADANPGTMAAVLGLGVPEVTAACQEADGAWVANDNTPAQVVVAGTQAGTEQAGQAALAAGSQTRDRPPGRWCLSLAPDAAGSSAARRRRGRDRFRPAPAAPWSPTSTPGRTPTASPLLLSAQLCSQVRWRESARRPGRPGRRAVRGAGAGDGAVGHGAPDVARRRLGPTWPGRPTSTPWPGRSTPSTGGRGHGR